MAYHGRIYLIKQVLEGRRNRRRRRNSISTAASPAATVERACPSGVHVRASGGRWSLGRRRRSGAAQWMPAPAAAVSQLLSKILDCRARHRARSQAPFCRRCATRCNRVVPGAWLTTQHARTMLLLDNCVLRTQWRHRSMRPQRVCSTAWHHYIPCGCGRLLRRR